VNLVSTRRTRCSHCGLRYLIPLQRSEAVGEERPHAEWPGSVVAPGTKMRVFIDASLDIRD
jgi:hypothetical protein